MKSPITTHILDTARGCPASGVEVILYVGESEIGRGETDADGRIGDLLPPETRLSPGAYRLSFNVGEYYQGEGFYPAVEISFLVKDPDQHYHVPLLLSPFGYSTYRGS